MRKILLAASLFFCVNTQAQLIADPTIEQVSFTDLSGNAIDDTMPIGYIAQLNIPIKNLDPVNGIPQGSCKIKIGLGTKIIIAPGFDLSQATTSEYFDWTASVTGGQVQITGELRVPLPADYSGIARFNVMGNVLEYSTVTTNFLVTNHNTQVILSDEDPGNNSSFRQYKIVPFDPIPVNFTQLQVLANNCNADIYFKTENEINVKQFDIEVSTDGILFSTAGVVTASNSSSYSYSTALTGTSNMYVRIKSVDHNGRYQYSNTRSINGSCKNNLSLSLYPNPVTSNKSVTIRAGQTLLNGAYEAILYDMSGKKISSRSYVFTNQQQFTYPLGNEACGHYLFTIINANDKSHLATFMIQKK